jgi:hypothetical protein
MPDDEKTLQDVTKEEFLVKCAQGKLEDVRELSNQFDVRCIETAAILSIINGQNLVAKYLVLSELGIAYLYNSSSRLVQFEAYYDEQANAFLKDAKQTASQVLLVKGMKVDKCIEKFGIESLQAELQRRPNKPIPEKGKLVERAKWKYDSRFSKDCTWHPNLLYCIKGEDSQLYYEALDSQFEDLSSLLKSDDPRLDALTKMMILSSVACGIFSLHCQNIGHGSITTSSILVKLSNGTQQVIPKVKLLTQSAITVHRKELVLKIREFYPQGNFTNIMAWDVFAFALVAREVMGPFSSEYSLNKLCELGLQYQKTKKVRVRIWEFVWSLTMELLRFSLQKDSFFKLSRYLDVSTNESYPESSAEMATDNG